MDAEFILNRAKSISGAVLDGIRANPIPAALTGGGIGWFTFQAILRSRHRVSEEASEEAAEEVREAVAAVQESGEKLMSELQEKGEAAGDGVRMKIAEWSRAAQEKLFPLGKRLRTRPENETLIFGAVTLGVGFLLGMIIAKIQGEKD